MVTGRLGLCERPLQVPHARAGDTPDFGLCPVQQRHGLRGGGPASAVRTRKLSRPGGGDGRWDCVDARCCAIRQYHPLRSQLHRRLPRLHVRIRGPPPSPPPSAPAHIASTDATASIYGLAIGIPVGVCLLGVAICSAVFWRLKRKRQTLEAGASADRAAPVQVELPAQPRTVTHQHSDLLTNTARTASTDAQHATPQQIAITVSQPEPLTKTAQVASPDLRDGDAGTTQHATGKGDVMEDAQPTNVAALLAACGLEHRATNFEDEGYTLEDLMGAMKQGGEAAVKSDLQDLKLTLGERRKFITELQRMDERARGQANASTPESGVRVRAQPDGPPGKRWL